MRLRYAYWVKCVSVEKIGDEVSVIHCTYDPATRGGDAPPCGRKVKGTIHWLAAPDATEVTYNLYDRLFTVPDPEESAAATGKPWTEFINPKSLVSLKGLVEKSVLDLKHGEVVQLERVGFFTPDKVAGELNLTVSLQDSWAEQTNKDSNEAKKKAADKSNREAIAAERAAKKKAKAEREAKKKAEKEESKKEESKRADS